MRAQTTFDLHHTADMLAPAAYAGVAAAAGHRPLAFVAGQLLYGLAPVAALFGLAGCQDWARFAQSSARRSATPTGTGRCSIRPGSLKSLNSGNMKSAQPRSRPAAAVFGKERSATTLGMLPGLLTLEALAARRTDVTAPRVGLSSVLSLAEPRSSSPPAVATRRPSSPSTWARARRPSWPPPIWPQA
ncbi:MAG: hypothetical protein R2854_30990 [Caldilineaceae bacterium]